MKQTIPEAKVSAEVKGYSEPIQISKPLLPQKWITTEKVDISKDSQELSKSKIFEREIIKENPVEES